MSYVDVPYASNGLLQWNLSKPVTFRPKFLGLNRQVAALTGGLVYNVSFGELIAVPYREVTVKTGSTVYTSAKVSDLIMP